jgi:hypothetical protein
MADHNSAYVRFRPTDRRTPGWWHLNAGGDLTRCGIKLAARKAPQYAEFADRVEWEQVCTACRPVN